MINIADNFSYQGSKPLDARLKFNSISDMVGTAAASLYDGCFAYVTATKKYYSYDSTNDTDPTLGKWREFQAGGADYTAGDGIAITNTVISVDPATTSAIGGVIPDGTTITVDSDGTIHSVGGSGSSGQMLTGTLLAASWSSKSQTVTISGLSTYNAGSIGILNTATTAQVEAAREAVIVPTTISSNSITFTCENVPSIDIPFGVLVGGGGSGGSDLPSGGTTGQLLAKHSNTDGDVEWVNAPSSIPNGGTTGQALVKHSNTDKDVEWATVGGLEYEEKTLGVNNFTYNKATLVENGETKIFYSKWKSGASYGNDVGLPSDNTPHHVDRHYYIEMTKNTAGTEFIQRCRKFYTNNDTNYVQLFERRCTSSSGTWTYPDWIEITASEIPAGGTTGQALIKHSNTDRDLEWSDVQPKLTAGANISIDPSTNEIAASYPLMVNEFDKANLYSTTEKVVGCWTDGRPVYQKAVELGYGPAKGATKSYNLNVSNPMVYVSCRVWYDWGTGTQGNTPSPNAHVWLDNSNLYISSLNDTPFDACPFHVILQYTKTTDVANSFNYASENDYSTTEKIVGTWIDGKPLYQKTINFGSLPNKSEKTVSTGLPSATTRPVHLTGFARRSSDGRGFTLPRSSGTTALLIDLSIRIVSNIINVAVDTVDNFSTCDESYITIQYTKTTD